MSREELIILGGDLDLQLDEFIMINGEWTLDGMPAIEWIEAMNMD